MPRIFDNSLCWRRETLRPALEQSTHADSCVGHFNLWGWQAIDDVVGGWSPD